MHSLYAFIYFFSFFTSVSLPFPPRDKIVEPINDDIALMMCDKIFFLRAFIPVYIFDDICMYVVVCIVCMSKPDVTVVGKNLFICTDN